MRLSSVFIRVGAFAAAALVSGVAARVAVATIESRSVIGVQEELLDYGHDWVTVIGDGLQVILEGQAPSEAERFRAISLSGRVVDASRVIDNMSVVATAGMIAPDFAIEILRNDSGVSLIGLVPATMDRADLGRRISTMAGDGVVSDLLETADYAAPDDWRPAVNFGLRALELLPRSKISVAPGRVAITASSDSPEQKARLETQLAQQVPDLIDVALNITAPRPVVSPYITRFTIDAKGTHLDVCTADTQASVNRITEAAKDAGLTATPNCVLALGVPSKTWGTAVVESIKAVKSLGAATVTLSDADVALVADETVTQEQFDLVVSDLTAKLPDLFALEASLTKPKAESDETIPELSLSLTEEGLVSVTGPVSDDMSNVTAENYAKARFGADKVTMVTEVVQGLPTGWSVRALTGIEVLSFLSSGSVVVEPETVIVRGETGNNSASSEIASVLVDKLGQAQKFDIDIKYVEKLDPLAGLPTPEECVEQIKILSVGRKITFDPGKASISASSLQLVDDIADILRLCLDLELEIAGYTDSQGAEEMNLRLSQQRADSVLSALRQRRIPTSAFKAVGFGEADPIASNETEEGREANRRIEFRLTKAEAPAEDVAQTDNVDTAEGATAESTNPDVVIGDKDHPLSGKAPKTRPEQSE